MGRYTWPLRQMEGTDSMLLNLSIENVALIEKADVNFGAGFNVLTGETGAGKSILIGSVNMLLGERVSRDIIRSGESFAYVEGLFYLTPKAAEQLLKLDIPPEEDNSLIVSRRLFSDGKNVCKAGGKTIPVSKLREIGRLLINVHGQHDNQALLDSTSHIAFLDAYVPEKDKYSFIEYDRTYSALKTEEQKLEKLNMDESEKQRRMDVLKYEIDEIMNAALYPGEEEELKQQRNLSKNKESIRENCSMALDLLYENSEGICVYNLLSEAKNALEDLAETVNGVESYTDKLAEMLYGLEDIVGDVREKLEQAGANDIPLDEIEQRLDTIFRLKRKYGNSEEEILRYCLEAEAELDDITTSEAQKTEAEGKIRQLTQEALALAEKNHDIRVRAATEIEKRIHKELKELNMENALFQVSFEPCELHKNGADKVEFLLSANRGEPPKPLSKIVSGGELSRIMLALKKVLVAGDLAGTLIFDEIDTGISGRAAGKVGQKLRGISEKKQVLCVTHLPQIASLSNHHFKISKETKGEKTITKIKQLNYEEKISEIALMIGGDSVTEITLAQAADMVEKGEKNGG